VPLVQALACPKEDGRIATTAHLEVRGHEGRVWALGDCAKVRAANGEPAPPSAQHATRQARVVAVNVVAALRGRSPQTYRPSRLGHLASLGHHSAVAEVLGQRFSGLPAWFLWRTVYLLKLPGLDRKARVALDWLAALAFPTDLVGLRVQPSDGIASEHFEHGEMIFEQGDVGDRAYVIRTGEVEVIHDGVRLGLLHAGDCFGEMALLSDRPRMASARATCPTDVLAIAKQDFAKLLASFPELETLVAGLVADRAAGRAM
jgi:NADH dehydrogenase